MVNVVNLAKGLLDSFFAFVLKLTDFWPLDSELPLLQRSQLVFIDRITVSRIVTCETKCQGLGLVSEHCKFLEPTWTAMPDSVPIPGLVLTRVMRAYYWQLRISEL